MRMLLLSLALFPAFTMGCAWEVGSYAHDAGQHWEIKSESKDSNGDRIVYRVCPTRAQWFNPVTGAITTDVELKNGKLHGEYRAYDHKTGELLSIGHYDNNVAKGIWMTFDSTGALGSLYRADESGKLNGVFTLSLDIRDRKANQSVRFRVYGVAVRHGEATNVKMMEAEEIGRIEKALGRFIGPLEVACVAFAKELQGEEQVRTLRYAGLGDDEIRSLRRAAIIR